MPHGVQVQILLPAPQPEQADYRPALVKKQQGVHFATYVHFAAQEKTCAVPHRFPAASFPQKERRLSIIYYRYSTFC